MVQGRLDLESAFATSGWTFSLDNHIRLEKPVLGPKDTRPGAPDYPVSLGFALLEDLRGNIALDLPFPGGSTTPRCRSAGWWARRSAGCSPRS